MASIAVIEIILSLYTKSVNFLHITEHSQENGKERDERDARMDSAERGGGDSTGSALPPDNRDSDSAVDHYHSAKSLPSAPETEGDSN